MTARLQILALTCFLSALPFFALEARAEGSGPVALSVSPERFEFTGLAGETRSGTLTVSNGTAETLYVVMEVEDFSPVGDGGAIEVGPGDDPGESIKGWVAASPEAFAVPPLSSVAVDFTLSAPADALAGTHRGVLLATTGTEAPDDPQVRIVTKAAAVVHFDILGDWREEVTLSAFSASSVFWEGPVGVALRFENTGTVRAKPRGAVAVRNVFGKEVTRLSIPEVNILPGAARRVSVSIGEALFAGRYTARLEASYGLTGEIPIGGEVSFWFVDRKEAGLPLLALFGGFLSLVLYHKRIWSALQALRKGDTTPSP